MQHVHRTKVLVKGNFYDENMEKIRDEKKRNFHLGTSIERKIKKIRTFITHSNCLYLSAS